MQDRGVATRERILDVAQAMIQERGYNGASFRDVSAVVNVKAASIHYYFPSKEDLVVALVDRYRSFFEAGREAINQKGASPARMLRQYFDVIKSAFRQSGRMCLCGVLASEMSTLPARVTEGVQGFFSDNENWLAEVLARGRTAGELDFEGSPKHAAQAFFAGVEGALMSAWTFKDEDRIVRVGKLMLDSVGAGA